MTGDGKNIAGQNGQSENGAHDGTAAPGAGDDAFVPQALVADALTGSVVYGFSFDEDQLQIDFLIREQTSTINQMMLEPRLDMRAGALLQNDVLIGVVLFTFNRHLAVYRTFWNFHDAPVETGDATNPRAHIFDLMCREAEANFLFVGDGGDFEYQLRAPHRLQDFFYEIRSKATALKPWSREQFTKEKAGITEAFPDPMDMWKAMSEDAETTP